MKRATALLATVGAAAAFLAPGAVADPTATVRLPVCQGNGFPGTGSGVWDVPAGSRILLGLRWIAPRGTLAQLHRTSDVTLRLNGIEIADADDHWSAIEPWTAPGEQEPGEQPVWSSEWLYDTGITLASPGDRLVVFSRFALVRRVRLTVPPDEGGGFLGSTENVLNGDHCTIRAR